MKKMIERMDRNVAEAQRRERERNKDSSVRESLASGGKKWGLISKKNNSAKERDNEEGPEGLRVDQYLVVFLKFMSSIGEFSFFLSSLDTS